MEIKRKIYKKIVEWKEKNNGSKALLIEGARRIGKSTVVEEMLVQLSGNNVNLQ